jgi:hypothetical protein
MSKRTVRTIVGTAFVGAVLFGGIATSASAASQVPESPAIAAATASSKSDTSNPGRIVSIGFTNNFKYSIVMYDPNTPNDKTLIQPGQTRYQHDATNQRTDKTRTIANAETGNVLATIQAQSRYVEGGMKFEGQKLTVTYKGEAISTKVDGTIYSPVTKVGVKMTTEGNPYYAYFVATLSENDL